MLCAGFIKHNIIAMPVAAMALLALKDRKHALVCAGVSIAVMAAGFAICIFLYGRAFVGNMMTPRFFSIPKAIYDAKLARFLHLPFAASAIVIWICRREERIQLYALFLAAAAVSFFLQKTGSGVDVNARFEFIMAVSIGSGLLLSYAAQNINWERSMGLFGRPSMICAILLLSLWYFIIPKTGITTLRAYRMFFDPDFQTEIQVREKAMVDNAERVRKVPGGVVCKSSMVLYRAGKPMSVDLFATMTRIEVGQLPKDALASRIRDGSLVEVRLDGRSSWGAPLVTQ